MFGLYQWLIVLSRSPTGVIVYPLFYHYITAPNAFKGLRPFETEFPIWIDHASGSGSTMHASSRMHSQQWFACPAEGPYLAE